MNAVKKLADMWPESINKILSKQDLKIPPEVFLAQIDTLICAVAISIANDPNRPNLINKNDTEVLDEIKKRYSGLFGQHGTVSNITNWYSQLNAECNRFRDARRQDQWATSWDHAKTLLFRTATTIMIAAVVLATGYLAKQWDIPLPMLRPLAGGG